MGGQYFKIVIVNQNKEVLIWLDPYNYGNGYLLNQHAYLNTPLLGAIEFLISPQGQFHKSRIIWAGDYSESHTEQLYSQLIFGDYKHKTPPAYDTRCYRYIVNHTKQIYVDKYPDGNSGIFDPMNKDFEYKWHPLPLLVLDNTNGGKGFYDGNDEELLGTWSGDVISVELNPPQEYKQLDCNFN